jgi:hypothetical protein
MTEQTATKFYTPKELADLIRKGQERYPEVQHTTGEYIIFNKDNETEPVLACALGFAMLGEWNGDIDSENVGDYISKIDAAAGAEFAFPYQNDEGMFIRSLADWVIAENDRGRKSLDHILSELEHARNISDVADPNTPTILRTVGLLSANPETAADTDRIYESPENVN